MALAVHEAITPWVLTQAISSSMINHLSKLNNGFEKSNLMHVREDLSMVSSSTIRLGTKGVEMCFAMWPERAEKCLHRCVGSGDRVWDQAQSPLPLSRANHRILQSVNEQSYHLRQWRQPTENNDVTQYKWLCSDFGNGRIDFTLGNCLINKNYFMVIMLMRVFWTKIHLL